MCRKKILLIDDERDFCYFTKMNLEETGKFEVVISLTADNGISAARKYKPDLILLDITMPGKDGLEALKAIKKDNETRCIPVIMFTINENDYYKEKAAGLYDEDYITKPVETKVLVDRIEKVLLKRNGIL